MVVGQCIARLQTGLDLANSGYSVNLAVGYLVPIA